MYTQTEKSNWLLTVIKLIIKLYLKKHDKEKRNSE